MHISCSRASRGRAAFLALAAGMVMLAATSAGALTIVPTAQDQRLMERAAQVALEGNRIGQSESWRNPATGHMGAVTPLRNYRLGAGQPCRDYEMMLTAAGRTEAARYSACRQPGGNWVDRDTAVLAGSQFAGRPIVSGPVIGAGATTVALTAHDLRLMERAAQNALENHPVGRSAAWSNPETGRTGAVTPLRNHRAGLDPPCRDYEMTVTSMGRTEIARHTACRQPDGAWVNREDGTLAGSRFVVAQPVALGPAPDEIPPVPLSKRDKEIMERTTQEALESNQIGQTANWSNSETGHLGGVTPTRSYPAEAGRTCRDFRMTVTTNGPTWVDHSTACRQLDGSWLDSRHLGPAGAFFEGKAMDQAELTGPVSFGSPPGIPRRPAVWEFPDER